MVTIVGHESHLFAVFDAAVVRCSGRDRVRRLDNVEVRTRLGPQTVDGLEYLALGHDGGVVRVLRRTSRVVVVDLVGGRSRRGRVLLDQFGDRLAVYRRLLARVGQPVLCGSADATVRGRVDGGGRWLGRGGHLLETVRLASVVPFLGALRGRTAAAPVLKAAGVAGRRGRGRSRVRTDAVVAVVRVIGAVDQVSQLVPGHVQRLDRDERRFLQRRCGLDQRRGIRVVLAVLSRVSV